MPYADYQPRGAAAELFACRDAEVLLSGPAGTGKSRACLEKVHAVAVKYPGSRQIVLRKTRASLTNTTLITYKHLVLPPDTAEVIRDCARYFNGSQVDFGGLDNPMRIMSSEYDIAYVPEATELTEHDWESVTTRLRWGKLPYQQMIADCNPGPPTHWLKRRGNSGKTLFLESRHEDNPTLWDGSAWTTAGAQYIEKLDSLTGARYLRLRKGLWAAAEGMVYDMWDAAVHIVDRFDIPKDWPRIWSIDFGFTNPFVFQAWARDRDGRMFRYKEIYRTQMLVEDHAKEILRVCAGEPLPRAIICDHDAEDRATLERHIGMFTVPAYKAVSPGIQAVQTRLRPALDLRPRLFLMRDSLCGVDPALVDSKKPTCTEEEIDSYVWASNPAGQVKDEPLKRDDHGVDAMRYAVAAADGIHSDPAEEKVNIAASVPYSISPV